MKKARPSALGPCARAPWLGHRHQTVKAEIALGHDVDAQITTALRGGASPTAPAALAIVEWVRREVVATAFYPQRKVALHDHEFREVLTEGTADLVAVHEPERHVIVADWKKKGQLWGGYIDTPDRHPQQLAYGLAAADELGADTFQVVHVFFDDENSTTVDARWSDVFFAEDWPALMARIRAFPDVDLDGPEPPATEGDHCNTCWQQRWCSARLLPAHQGPTALEPFTQGLTLERLPEAIDVLERFDKAVKLASEKAWAQVEGLVQLHGPVRVGGKEYGFFPQAGKRRGPKLEELEAEGLGHLIKPGETKTAFGSRKAR